MPTSTDLLYDLPNAAGFAIRYQTSGMPPAFAVSVRCPTPELLEGVVIYNYGSTTDDPALSEDRKVGLSFLRSKLAYRPHHGTRHTQLPDVRLPCVADVWRIKLVDARQMQGPPHTRWIAPPFHEKSSLKNSVVGLLRNAPAKCALKNHVR